MTTMPLPQAIAELMKVNDCGKETAAAFLREFADVVSSSLSEGEVVVIKGFGTFKCIESGGEAVVEFAPDRKIADAVNAPFSLFEPIELDEDITDEDLKQADDNVAEHFCDVIDSDPIVIEDENKASIDKVADQDVDSGNKDAVVVGDPGVSTFVFDTTEDEVVCSETCVGDGTSRPLSDVDAVDGRREVLESDADSKTTDDVADDVSSVGVAAFAPADTSAGAEHDNMPCRDYGDEAHGDMVRVVERHVRSWVVMVLIAVVALLVGLVAGYFAYGWLNLRDVRSVNISAEDVHVVQRPKDVNAEIENNKKDSVPSESVTTDVVDNENGDSYVNVEDEKDHVATLMGQSAQVVTDTVTRTRFLSTMARAHYGKTKFWVYIYEENRSKLVNPHHIEPMTVVVIPPAEKYGIKAGDAASEADAERRAAELLSRYPAD